MDLVISFSNLVLSNWIKIADKSSFFFPYFVQVRFKPFKLPRILYRTLGKG